MKTNRSHAKGKDCKLYKHGESSVGRYKSGNPKFTRLYRAWHHMKDDKSIEICKDWKKSFTSFRTWAHLNGYDEAGGVTHFIRKDKQYGWCPENVIISALIGFNHVFLTHDNVTMSLCDWARKIGLTKQALWGRLYQLHWSVEKALTFDIHQHDECTFD